ncbi:FecR domain-containing protein [Desertivirga xinjiangensis]|uniref:FecR domain-containing protein n=1 Tax=Desertivirga xinjiangensis TaxID=539206 RepID=UPI00210BF40D|nr:FecR domain-containing protein [Pedobacter xinjiangensis]
MDKIKAEELFQKYTEGKCTEEEKLLFESLYNKVAQKQESLSSPEDFERIKKIIYTRLPQPEKQHSIKRWYTYAAVACLAIAVGAALFYRAETNRTNLDLSKNKVYDIPPGGNKAVLTLADGRKIVLNNIQNGELADEAGIKITKTGDGQLAYHISDAGDKQAAAVSFNVIETPNGGQYQVTLPDGTKVWLNAASSLKYPVRFSSNERLVELSGEGYFEVAKNTKKPFRVASGNQKVEVLGTHFNINSYSDEPAIRTTLTEGAVRVIQTATQESRLLKPGEQSVLESNRLSVRNADMLNTLAWKNGEFIFDDGDFRAVMRNIARWYDIEVVYDPSAPLDFELGGFISRSKNISAVLKLIELTGKVHFKIEGRRVFVTK